MGKHTPGPWHIWKEDIGRERTQRISGKDGFCLALAYGETEDETSSNARLIAEAPMMYEALKSAATMFPGVPYPDERKLLENITALLARIEGGE